MIELNIPGYGEVKITNLIFDFNGTLATDGTIPPEVMSSLQELSKQFTLHVVTGDSLGTARQELAPIDCHIEIIPAANQAQAKLDYLQNLPAEHTAMIGNGRNDVKVLKSVRIGVVILGGEGTAVEAIQAADIVVANIMTAIGLFIHPNRLCATLRG